MIWTFLKKCWQKGWLYRGVDVMPWCPRCATASASTRSLPMATPSSPIEASPCVSPARAREGILIGVDDDPLDADSNVAAAVGLTWFISRSGRG